VRGAHGSLRFGSSHSILVGMKFADPAHVHIHFARSSGPGGQNVNKRTYATTYAVNTKVYARLELGPRAPRVMPPALVRELAKRSVGASFLTVPAYVHTIYTFTPSIE